jgi:acetyl-CoA acetyltransferase
MHRSRQAPDQVGSGKRLARAGLELGDIDLLELGVAFAAMARKRRRQFDSRERTGATDGYCY